MTSISKEMNPFVIGNYVSDEYFCDREQETALLKKQMQNGRNVSLISDRRIGKSGLISHLFAQEDIQQQFYTISIDLYATNSLAECICLFSDAIYRKVKQQTSTWKDKFFRIINSLRVGFKLDAVSGEPIFDIGIGDIASPTLTLEQIFTFLELTDKPCIVSFDEFQQIAAYDEKNVEALFRTHIQRCKQTRFIFAGSRKHLMAQMFLSPSKPFYQSTINMGLDVIPQDTYSAFAQSMFARYDKYVESEIVEQVYQKFYGITWYIQVMMNELFTLTPTGGICINSMIPIAMRNIIFLQEPFYKEILAAISPKQKSLLYAIAKDGEAKNITSADFIKKHRLTSTSSVQAALKGLTYKDIIIANANVWRIYDVFFEQYINLYSKL